MKLCVTSLQTKLKSPEATTHLEFNKRYFYTETFNQTLIWSQS